MRTEGESVHAVNDLCAGTSEASPLVSTALSRRCGSARTSHRARGAGISQLVGRKYERGVVGVDAMPIVRTDGVGGIENAGFVFRDRVLIVRDLAVWIPPSHRGGPGMCSTILPAERRRAQTSGARLFLSVPTYGLSLQPTGIVANNNADTKEGQICSSLADAP